MSNIIYRRNVNYGAVLVVERTLTDLSKVHDVHVWIAGERRSTEVFNASSESDAIARCDKIAEALS